MNFKLKARIIENFGSQFAFARKLQVRECFISEVLRSRRRLTAAQAANWSKALGCDVAALVDAEKAA